MFWIACDSSFPEGPLDSFEEACEEAFSLSSEFKEPVVVYSGNSITTWEPIDVVFCS